MTPAAHPHDVLLQQVQQEFADIFAGTTQGIYIYLDDPHWIGNDRLATMLGYASAAELVKVSAGSALMDVLVAPESQQRVIDAYTGAAERKVASSAPVTWKKKAGGTVKSQTIFVPISFKGTVLVLHFVTPA
jgi:hypothetical protein